MKKMSQTKKILKALLKGRRLTNCDCYRLTDATESPRRFRKLRERLCIQGVVFKFEEVGNCKRWWIDGRYIKRAQKAVL